MKKNLLSVLGLAVLASTSLTGCGNNSVTIGILQPVEHIALGLAREGFIQGLKDNGFANANIVYRNAGGNDADLVAYAKDLVDTSSLTLGIGTGASLALKGAEDNAGYKKPLLFTAVTDPVGAKLVQNDKAPEGFVTGSSDMQPAEALNNQIKLVKKMIPTATKLGIFYCANEQNSQAQAELASAAAVLEGLDVTTSTCLDQMDIRQKVGELAPQVDAIWIPTDNTVANNMSKVKDGLGTNKTLVIVGEEGMLNGGQLTVSISYYELGLKTAELAVKVLEGKAISEIPVYYSSADICSNLYNKQNLEDAGFAVSDLPTDFTWEEYKG